MELNSSINTFVGGMSLDVDKSLLKENQYIYAEDIRLLANKESTGGILQSRDCLQKFENSILQKGEIILGTVATKVPDDSGKSEECVIVVTMLNDFNNIYIVYIKDSIITKKLVTCNFGYTSEVKIIGNYESDVVSKIYIADGINPIRVINITKQYDENVQSTDFELIPAVSLHRPTLKQIVLGNLQVGTVQYAYQLFSKHGTESTISPVSELINIPKTHSNNQKDTYGGNKEEISNVGVQINIKFSDRRNLDMFRLYRIRYVSNKSLPDIYIVTEFEIDDDGVIYNDVTDSFISKITVDEFNMLTLSEFIPNTIEKHENRLFAAGIKEETWDIGDFDTRAYRCDINGYTELHHSDITQNISGKLTADGKIGGNLVPLKHDCINPSNGVIFGEDDHKYVYGFNEKGDLILGGTGVNVSYCFCHVPVVLSDKKPVEILYNSELDFAPSLELGISSQIVQKDNIVPIYDLNLGNKIGEHVLDKEYKIRYSYSDSYFASKFRGYQRDEIYRFGIVFYNKKGQKTPVYWIADIRMPSHQMALRNDSPILPFNFNSKIIVKNDIENRGNDEQESFELVGNALGLKFKLRELPIGAVSWEIVRCQRDEINRTIVAQGATSSLINFTSWGKYDEDFGDSDIRPMGLLNLTNRYRVNSNDQEIPNMFHTVVDNYIEFVSPEVCIQKDSISDNIENNYLCELNWNYTYWPYQNYINGAYESGSDFWGIRQKQMFSNYSEKSPIQTYYYAGCIRRFDGDSENPSIEFGDSRVDGADGLFGGGAVLAKYYQSHINGRMDRVHKIENAIVSKPLPQMYTNEEVKTYIQPFVEKNYVNTSVLGYRNLQNHGVSAILKMPNGFVNRHSNGTAVAYEPYSPVNVPNELAYTSLNSTRIANIKQNTTLYSGNTYSTRSNCTYVSCGNVSESTYEQFVFGGDTYLCIFDYAHTTIRQKENDTKKNAAQAVFVNCYIPLETCVNLDLLSSDTYGDTVTDNMGQNLIQYEPIVSQSYTQTKPLYEYNSAYSADASAQLFTPKLLYGYSSSVYETRITCSELKTNNELIDSWTKFKFANYLDIDNQYGPVTNLKSFNGKLLFWQDSAVGVAAVNERSLIQDNNISQLTLGTGGILVRYDYYTTTNGSSELNDRSICNSSSTLYWFDSSKKEICGINDTVIELAKVKGVKSWCNNQINKMSAWFDHKYNELCISNGKESIVFNEQLNVFTGFYKYPTSHSINLVDKLISLDENGFVYLHGAEENYESFEPTIKYVVNKEYNETKVFDNVSFDAEFNNDSKLLNARFNTKTQKSLEVNHTNVENREDNYRFAVPREKPMNDYVNKNISYVGRMRGKYLICDYTFSCKKDGDFKIPYIKTTFRTSRI